MTCAFCGFEFCWSCGASASSNDRHFDAGNGCGVTMMDASVRPGEHLRRKSIFYKLKKIVQGLLGMAFAIIILVPLLPIFLVFFMPVMFSSV